MKKILIIFSFLLLVSCKNEALEKKQTTNDEFNVELLFEVDGCKVYRFQDASRNRYFTNCKGSVSWKQQEGKVDYDLNIPTE